MKSSRVISAFLAVCILALTACGSAASGLSNWKKKIPALSGSYQILCNYNAAYARLLQHPMARFRISETDETELLRIMKSIDLKQYQKQDHSIGGQQILVPVRFTSNAGTQDVVFGSDAQGTCIAITTVDPNSDELLIDSSQIEYWVGPADTELASALTALNTSVFAEKSDSRYTATFSLLDGSVQDAPMMKGPAAIVELILRNRAEAGDVVPPSDGTPPTFTQSVTIDGKTYQYNPATGWASKVDGDVSQFFQVKDISLLAAMQLYMKGAS